MFPVSCLRYSLLSLSPSLSLDPPPTSLPACVTSDALRAKPSGDASQFRLTRTCATFDEDVLLVLFVCFFFPSAHCYLKLFLFNLHSHTTQRHLSQVAVDTGWLAWLRVWQQRRLRSPLNPKTDVNDRNNLLRRHTDGQGQ